jgi:hypothetical protein
MKKIVVFMLLMAAMATSGSVLAQSSNATDKSAWTKIGEVTANFKSETESIPVTGTDKFKSLKLKVTDAPINIESVQVFYDSGKKEDVSISNQLSTGNETKVIDLKNAGMDIEKIVFKYKTVPGNKNEKAHVELYGLKS